jgi:3-isopropylmalate/(R)-2-methylmalate dehydratase small subunit
MSDGSQGIEAVEGRAWTLGDDVDTGQIAPGHAMRKPIEQLATHCLESLLPEFARSVQRGDVLVAGQGFGIGSSREQAPQALRYLGISVVVARSFGRIFYRNAFNLGLPVMVCPSASDVEPGDRVRVDFVSGRIMNLTRRVEHQAEPIPGFLLEMITDGGLIPHLHARLQRERSRVPG